MLSRLLVLTGLVGGLVALVAACASWTVPGCRAYGEAAIADLQAKGYTLQVVLPVGPKAQLLAFTSADGSAVGLVVKLDESAPPDDALTKRGFVQLTACTWDGPVSVVEPGTSGTIWRADAPTATGGGR